MEANHLNLVMVMDATYLPKENESLTHYDDK